MLTDSSGIQTYTRFLAEELVRGGHEVLVVERTGGALRNAPHGTTLVHVPPYRHHGPITRYATPIADARSRRIIARVVERARPDVVHVTRAAMTPRVGARLVLTTWDPEPTITGRLRVARARGLDRREEVRYAVTDRLVRPRADALIAVTQALQQSLSRYREVTYIPPFLPDERVEAPLPSRSNDVVMVANGIDSARKGMELAIDAVRAARKRLPDMRLVLIGYWNDPAGMNALPDFCDARGLLAPDAVRDALRGAGCCIVPSLWEEFGYAGLESLAAGTPVVCGPLPGLVGLQTTGVLVSGMREPEAFARLLVEAVALESFEFPTEARASTAVPRILDVYSGRSPAPG